MREQEKNLQAGVKFDGVDKLRWELLPVDALTEVVKRYTHGANKYAPNGYVDVDNPIERYYAALMRHLVAWRLGQKYDPDAPDLTHLSAVAWNALTLIWFELHPEKITVKET